METGSWAGIHKWDVHDIQVLGVKSLFQDNLTVLNINTIVGTIVA